MINDQDVNLDEASGTEYDLHRQYWGYEETRDGNFSVE